ncbi:hypothetical protein O181_018480 [Austropuccinia psidii MF-1]|uniref:Uncharacterized protein n=1 Tax=Austropuccinia psidii MF-1 TaxID=1389203 RepID=A0A9Q3GU34_9BASI|nr:hypothetical protein [Austropuccinia psidii MF-1]
MGGYKEGELYFAKRPLTTFGTPLGRMKLERLPQGATNSVAVYQAQITWILQEEIPESLGILIDDGPKKRTKITLQPRNTTRKPLNYKTYMGICHNLRKHFIQA